MQRVNQHAVSLCNSSLCIECQQDSAVHAASNEAHACSDIQHSLNTCNVYQHTEKEQHCHSSGGDTSFSPLYLTLPPMSNSVRCSKLPSWLRRILMFVNLTSQCLRPCLLSHAKACDQFGYWYAAFVVPLKAPVNVAAKHIR